MKTLPRPRAQIASSRGATSFELLVFLLLIGCVLAGMVFAPGLIRGPYARLLGAFLGLLLFLLGVSVWCGLKAVAFDGIPRLPQCREGSCRGEDYQVTKFGAEFLWVCRHGGRYARRGRRFVRVSDDGTELPHLIWRPFRGWRPDRLTPSEALKPSQ